MERRGSGEEEDEEEEAATAERVRAGRKGSRGVVMEAISRRAGQEGRRRWGVADWGSREAK